MNVQKQIGRLISEQASQWLETLRSGKTEDYPEFVRWIGESPRHVQELMALVAIGEELPGAFARANIDRDVLLRSIRSNVRVLEKEDVTPPLALNRERKTKSRLWKIAAAVAVMISLGALRGSASAKSVRSSQQRSASKGPWRWPMDH